MNLETMYEIAYDDLINHAQFDHIDYVNQCIHLVDDDNDVWLIVPEPVWASKLKQQFGIESYGLFGITNSDLMYFDIWFEFENEQMIYAAAYTPGDSFNINMYVYQKGSYYLSPTTAINDDLKEIIKYMTEHLIKEHPKSRFHFLYETANKGE